MRGSVVVVESIIEADEIIALHLIKLTKFPSINVSFPQAIRLLSFFSSRPLRHRIQYLAPELT